MPDKISAIFFSLKFRNFRLLWSGQFSTSMGLHMDIVARGWLMYELTNSPFMLGLTGAIRGAPVLFLSLLAGVLADRYGRKPPIIISQLTHASVNLLLAVLIISRMIEPWHILATGLVAGIAQAFQMPARQAIVSDLVDEKYLANALALNSISFNVSRTLGPMLAGALIAFVGAGGSYFFQAAIYLFATVWTVQMTVPATSSQGKDGVTLVGSLMEGLRYIKSDKTVLSLLFLAVVPILIGQPYTSLMPIFAKDIMKVGPKGLGLLLGAVGLGSLGGALLSATIYREGHRGALLLGNAIIFGVFLGFFAFTPWFIAALPLLAIAGAAQTGYFVLNNTLIQTLTPRQFRGRVMGVDSLEWGMMPLGIFLAGGIAGVIGAPFTVGILAALCALVPLYAAITVPHVRQLK